MGSCICCVTATVDGVRGKILTEAQNQADITTVSALVLDGKVIYTNECIVTAFTISLSLLTPFIYSYIESYI